MVMEPVENQFMVEHLLMKIFILNMISLIFLVWLIEVQILMVRSFLLPLVLNRALMENMLLLEKLEYILMHFLNNY